MDLDERFIARCFDLARQGEWFASPNPMVGSVVVHRGKIIGEGYHRKAGEAHAEVNAINSVDDHSLLPESTIYVSLEPCSHFGKTPPCSDLIIEKKIGRVVIAIGDPFAKVNGAGIAKLKKAGIDVRVGVLEDEAWELNKKFFTFHSKDRPFITLKWAETADGFVDAIRKDDSSPALKVTGKRTQQFTHRLRANHNAILIGYNTALLDKPKLDNRLFSGPSPTRLIIDRDAALPPNLDLFIDGQPTVVFGKKKRDDLINVEQVIYTDHWLEAVMQYCRDKQLLSLFVEGGSKTLESFIENSLWDEAYRLKGSISIENGIPAPQLSSGKMKEEFNIGPDCVIYYQNNNL